MESITDNVASAGAVTVVNVIRKTVSAMAGVAVYYDEKADAVSIRIREGAPRHVVAGRGSFVLYIDEQGLWAVDIEVKEWDGGDREEFLSLRGRAWLSP
ncbi:MAG: hypothetical protein ABWK05_08770 [Pyrobaculum sp.]